MVKTCYLCGSKSTGQYRPMPDGRWVCRSGYACQKRIRASVALAIEIQGLYDGTCVWLLKDGRYINRFAGKPGSPASLIARVDAWIAQHGNQIRADNTDLPDDCTVDDYVAAAGTWPPPNQPAGADERPVQTVSAPADPSPVVGAAGAGGFPIDDAAIARVIAPVLRCCGIRASQTTAEIVAREVTHFFDVTHKRD